MSYHQCEACGSGHICNAELCQHDCPVPHETPTDENGILKKAEQERDNANFQWRYMVQEISTTTGVPCGSPADAVGVVRDLLTGAEAYRTRAEKAEQERDKLAEGYERRRQELDAQYAEIKKLQADLDAALVLCVASDWDVEVLGAGYEPEVYKAHAHVLPLLEKRREEKRG